MSETRNLLRASAERLFADLSTAAVVAGAEKGGWPATLWQAIEQAGMPRAGTGEEAADTGDLAALAGAAAYRCAPVPLVETMLAHRLAAASGATLPDGPLSVATMHKARLSRRDSQWRLTGVFYGVPWGARAGCIAAIVRDADGEKLVFVPAGSGTIASGTSLAGEPRDEIRFDGTALPDEAVRDTPVSSAQLSVQMRLFRLTQISAALERTLSQTVHYARERVQFGRPIGSFQAIQQQVAVQASEAAASAAAVAAAVAAAERGDAMFEIAAAAIRVCDAISVSASIAHQVHGAMGVTHEHPLHQSTRRLWAWRDELGDDLLDARAIGAAVAKGGGQELWAFMCRPALPAN